MLEDRRRGKVLFLFIAALTRKEVAVSSCVSFTSTVDDAGNPGPGSGACLPYTVEVSAVAGTVLLSGASATAAAQAPAMDIAVLVDESGSVEILCEYSLDCYENEKDFAVELVTLLDDSVRCVAIGWLHVPVGVALARVSGVRWGCTR